jgi:hypothetical protein
VVAVSTVVLAVGELVQAQPVSLVLRNFCVVMVLSSVTMMTVVVSVVLPIGYHLITTE